MFRGFIAGAVAVVAAGACDEGGSASTVRLTLDAPLPNAEVCFAVAILDADGETVATRGDRAAATREAAVASGAVCVEGESAVTTLRCAPGKSTAVSWIIGVWNDGSTVPSDDYQNSCGADGCTNAFDCVAGEEVDAGFDLTILRDAHQGFFNIAFSAPDPGVGGLCAAVRVVNSEGLVIWAEPDLCVDQFGDGRGTFTYVGTCDADAPDHTITIVVQPPPNAVGWTNPCPGDAAGTDARSWTGGCAKTAACIEDTDVVVDLDYDDQP